MHSYNVIDVYAFYDTCRHIKRCALTWLRCVAVFEVFSFYFKYFFLLRAGSRLYIMPRPCLEFDIFIASAPSERTTAHYHRNAKAELSFATVCAACLNLLGIPREGYLTHKPLR
jgi:hypothetical protein